MARDRLGGVPYELKKEGGKVKLRFYPKSENAQNPDAIVFLLALDNNDRKKLAEIIKK